MIKIGDKVAPFNNMGLTGVVVGLEQQKSKEWIVGGAISPLWLVKVQLDKDNSEVTYRGDELMRID